MRAFVIPTPDGPSAGELRAVPEPQGAHTWAAGERLLIDVHAAGISFPDVLQGRGTYQHGQPPPYVAGGEACGVVLEAPPGSRFAPGDRVASLCLWGALAERALGLPAYTVKLPDDMSFIDGAALQLNYSTAWFSCHRIAVQPGERVLIHGAAGGVGTATIQAVTALGAIPIALVSTPAKAEIARAAGAEIVLGSGKAWLADVRDLTGNSGVDAVIDPVGGDDITDSLRALGVGGRLAVVGFASGRIPQVKVNRLLLRDLSLVGIALAPFVERYPQIAGQLADALESMACSGAIRPVVGAVLDLPDSARALELIESRQALGKVVVRVRS
ncbi:MAG: NADPH:quinone oxidoreductase family protein [Tetrasphaera sp.]